jgi:hypothetical protein
LYSNSDGICIQLAIFIPLLLFDVCPVFWLTKEKPETLKIMGEKYLTLQGLHGNIFTAITINQKIF